jgi:hypothetical protein
MIRIAAIKPRSNNGSVAMLVKVGKGIEIEVDVDRLIPAVIEHVVYTGLRNLLMDAHAAATAKDDPTGYLAKSRELVERKLAGLYAGEIRRVGSPTPTDPLSLEVRRIATGIVRQRHATELAAAPSKDRLAMLNNLVDQHVTEHGDELRPIAERQLAEIAELIEPTEKPKKTKRAA